jgi:hypothetical protein
LNREFPGEAIEFAAAVRGALDRLGGCELARRAEADPSLRQSTLRPALDDLGFLDLAPLDGELETAAAALGLREAGAVACPWPLVQQVSVPATASGHDALYVGSAETARLAHLDLLESPLLLTPDGVPYEVSADSTRTDAVPLDPFGAGCALSPASAGQAGSLELYFVLDAFYILGGLRTVFAMTAEYAGQRQQFGRPIGRFGAARWRLSDMAVATSGLEELAAYTLWLLIDGRIRASDALALRFVTLDSAAIVLHQGHQLFAAIGLCDEHDLALIDRHLQPALRRPFGLAAANRQFAASLDQHGFDALFPIGQQALAAAEH